MKNKNLGFIAVIISATIFGSMPLIVKTVYSNGGNAISVLFYRFFLSLPILYLIVKMKKDVDMKVTKTELKNLILVSIFGFTPTALLLFISYNYISTGMATTVHFVYPMFVFIGSVLFYKDKPNLIKALCVVLCTVGVVLFAKDPGKTSFLGILLAAISGVTFAFYILFVDKTGLKEMYLFKQSFYLCFISSVIVFTYSIITGTFTMDLTLTGWLLSMVLSVFISVGAVTLFQYGIKMVGPQDTAIFGTFEPITSVVIGIIAFDEIFDIRTLIGSIFIISAVVITAICEKSNVDADL